MKNIVLIFLCLFSIVKADYLISNGEIALFYDGKNNVLKNIRGDISKRDEISNIDILFIKDYKIYNARDYYTKVEYIQGKNILRLEYSIENQKIETYVILSNSTKSRMYLYTDLSKIRWKKGYKIVYRISPTDTSGEVLNNENYYSYRGVNFLKDSNLNLFLASPFDFNKFKVKVLEDKLIKGLDEKIYLWKTINENNSGNLLSIDFKNFIKSKNENFDKIYGDEVGFWLEFNKKYSDQKKLTVDVLKDFYILQSDNSIQTKLNENLGKERYLNKLKLFYIKALLSPESIDNEFFTEILFQNRKGMDMIYYYYYFLKIAEIKGLEISDGKFLDKITSNLRENLLEGYTEISNREGNWKLKSYIFYEFLNNIEKNMDINKIADNMEELKEKVRVDLEEEILNDQGYLKRKGYIKYMRILSKEKFDKNIKSLIVESNNSYGILRRDNKNLIIPNLELALILYEEGYKNQSDRILNSTGYFLFEEENQSDIVAEEIFLYIKNIYYRGLI